MEIRSPGPNEKGAWIPLWNGYLHFYGANLSQDLTDRTWERFHDPNEPIYLIGAYLDSVMVGFVTYLFHRSTWAEHNYCYLEDLYVAENARGHHCGQELISAVQKEAQLKGSARLYWNTREGNTAARSLYNKVAQLTDFVQYRMSI